MWNVDTAGNIADVGLALRLAIADSVDQEDGKLLRNARVFAKYLAQTLSGVDAANVHVVSTGTFGNAGASGVTLEITIL